MGNPNLEQSDQTAPVLTHFSHPHPLKFSNTAVYSHCSACKFEASGAAYSCTLCSFTLHEKCYYLPQKIKHEFDQTHVLSLQPQPVYPEGVFKCDACGIQGDGFSYHCSPCGTDLHSICASLPMMLTHDCHQHQLSLTFSAPYSGNAFSCDICKRVGSKTWLYRCNLCEFDVHLTCVAKIPSSTVHKHQMIPQSPQHNLTMSISEPPNIYPSNTGVYGVARPPHHSASLGHPQNQFVATPYQAAAMSQPFPAAAMGQPYPAAVTPMISVPNNNFNQPPATYGAVRPANGLGNQILGNAVNGIASGVAQAMAQALLQGSTGGGGGAGGSGGGVGVVNLLDATGGGAGTTDGNLYVDGGNGGTDVGYDAGGGEFSYY